VLLVLGSVSSSITPFSTSPFTLVNNALAKDMTGAGDEGSGGGNSGGGDGGDSSSSSDSAKKGTKHKKEDGVSGESLVPSSDSGNSGGDSSSHSKKGNKHKNNDGGDENGGAGAGAGVEPGNTNTISGTDVDLINDMFGIGNGSSSSAATATTTSAPSTTTEQEQPISPNPPQTVKDLYSPPELPQNFGLVSSQKILGDGSKVQIDLPELPRVGTTTWFPNATVTKVWDQDFGGAHKEKWIPVGDSRWIYSDERLTREPNLAAKYTREPDGTRTWNFPDGATKTSLPDYTEIDKKPAPDTPGQFIVTTTKADNTKIVKDPDGKETFIDAEGNTQKIVFPKKDGTFDVYNPNTGTTTNTNTKPDR
jgi:hypothetical protein